MKSLALLSICLLPVFACHDLSPKQQARLDQFECQAAALAEVVEPTLNATELLRDLYAGKADLAQALGAVSATQGEVQRLLNSLRECGTEFESDEPLLQTNG